MLGYIMLSISFKNALGHEREACLSEYQLLKFALQSNAIAAGEGDELTRDSAKYIARLTVDAAPGLAAVLTGEGEVLVSSFQKK